MIFPIKFKCLDKIEFSLNQYKLNPIEASHRFLIRKWRNEQISILRQSNELSAIEQDLYFEKVVALTFSMDRPAQILFSFFESSEFNPDTNNS